MSDKVISDVNGLEPGELIDLFELDLSTGIAPDSEAIFRWHSGYNENLQEIVWQGNRYSAFPVEASGFAWTGKGSIPKPSLTVANVTSLLTSVIDSYDDLVGAKVTRKRTFAKYLDAYCYTGGFPVGGSCAGESGGSPYSLSKADCLDATKNGSAGTWTAYNSTTCAASNSNTGIWYASALADDTAYFTDEIWYIDRKSVETRTHIQFELSAAHDVQGVTLPARKVIANLCPWKYKGVECGYSGTNYFDIDNASTDAAGDVCSKNFRACELRFPEPQEIPFGGFPGAGMNMG
jgi:phage-related protein